MSHRSVLCAVGVLAVLACAKKMMPPSPDRFSPGLEGIVTRNRSQVELVFDEPIDPSRVSMDSFYVTDANGLGVRLRGVSQGRQQDRVLLWTPIQTAQVYQVQGVVWDVAGNMARIRARFRGSDRQDTIAPTILRVDPSAGAVRLKRAATVSVRFSEPADTSAVPYCIFVPDQYDTMFERSWESDWQTLRLTYADTLTQGEVVYCQVFPGISDLEGNRSRGTAFTYFTPDSTFTGEPVKGRATWRHGLLGTGTVFFFPDTPASERATGLAALLADGSFATRLAPGTYRGVAVADTDFDGRAELSAPLPVLTTPADSLLIELEPETLARPIDAFRRH